MNSRVENQLAELRRRRGLGASDLARRVNVTRQTIFVVQCSQDGYVTIEPQGGTVSRVGDAFLLTAPVRIEYTELAVALERGIPEQAQ